MSSSPVALALAVLFLALEIHGKRTRRQVSEWQWYGALLVYGLIAVSSITTIALRTETWLVVPAWVTLPVIAATVALSVHSRRSHARRAQSDERPGSSSITRHSARKLAVIAAVGFVASSTGRLLQQSGGLESLGSATQPVALVLLIGGILLILVSACLYTADVMRSSEHQWRRSHDARSSTERD